MIFMKYILILSMFLSVQSFAENIQVQGRYKQEFFNGGYPAILNLKIENGKVDADLVVSGAVCSMQFSQGTLISTHVENYIYVGKYENYSLPIANKCEEWATDIQRLTIRRDFEGNLISISIGNKSRRNRYVYFSSKG